HPFSKSQFNRFPDNPTPSTSGLSHHRNSRRFQIRRSSSWVAKRVGEFAVCACRSPGVPQRLQCLTVVEANRCVWRNIEGSDSQASLQSPCKCFLQRASSSSNWNVV